MTEESQQAAPVTPFEQVTDDQMDMDVDNFNNNLNYQTTVVSQLDE